MMNDWNSGSCATSVFFVVDEQNLNMIEIIKLHSDLTHDVRVWVCRANYDAFRPCLRVSSGRYRSKCRLCKLSVSLGSFA